MIENLATSKWVNIVKVGGLGTILATNYHSFVQPPLIKELQTEWCGLFESLANKNN